ncbi:MAG TPA: translation elongation factor Ts [Chromatiaceae bacterium]|nr:translation elongation factor Ts [Chromatiaceae bacterium]
MAVTAALGKELRERTGAGMMECKKALTENGGDIEATIEAMRKSGQAKAAKKAGRIAADGVVVIRIAEDGKSAVVLEVNSETDFVAKDAGFQAFAEGAAAQALASSVQDVAELSHQPMPGTDGTVDQAREALISKIGENIQLRRLVRYKGASGRLISYRHGVRIGVLVEVEGGDEALGKDLAMHIAASNPMCVDASGVAPEALEKEKDIFRVQALQSGKPEAIVEKMIEGRVRKFLEEVTLVGQPFVKNPELTVEKLLKQAGAKVIRFSRMEVGEGIQKREENFADEVMSQVRAAE